MRESVKDFIKRVISEDDYRVRIEANDMLPITATKAELVSGNKVDGLYVIKMEITGWNSITITAGYHS